MALLSTLTVMTVRLTGSRARSAGVLCPIVGLTFTDQVRGEGLDGHDATNAPRNHNSILSFAIISVRGLTLNFQRVSDEGEECVIANVPLNTK
jgi:hypothetical protein